MLQLCRFASCQNTPRSEGRFKLGWVLYDRDRSRTAAGAFYLCDAVFFSSSLAGETEFL